MDGYDCEAWQGAVTQGELAGYSIEVRQQRLPWRLYVLAFTPATSPGEPIIGFAIGRNQLAGHLKNLGVVVTWEDGRGPLAPERDRANDRVPRRMRRTSRMRRKMKVTRSAAGANYDADSLMAQDRRSSRR